jgi:hypothetical protein
MVHSGTWERHVVPTEASNESKRRRRKYGDMPVGPGHIRGTDGVMPIQSREFGDTRRAWQQNAEGCVADAIL